MIVHDGQCFVYKLLEDNEVVYVGQTSNIFSRIYQHQIDKNKEFNSVEVIECAKHDVDEMEFAYICRFSPKLNKDLPTVSYSVRDTAAKAYNRCISNNIVAERGFDLKTPDFKVTLGGKAYGLWAKKGEEGEFFSQMEYITKIIKAIKQ